MSETEKKSATTTAGRDISMVGFILAVASIFVNIFTVGGMSLAGLALSIIGRVQSAKAGQPNAYALAGIIISAIVTVLTFILLAVFALWLMSQPEEEGYYIDCSGEYEHSAECRSDDEILYPQSKS